MTSGPTSKLAGLLLLASRIVWLIVIASFVIFVIDQTSAASTHQQNELSGTPQPPSGSAAARAKHESTLHRTVDEASETLTSPFAGVVSRSPSQSTIHIVKTLLALLAYGLGV